MRVLVTAGPTREPIDPVRFLSNRSSGRMGYALAQALLDSGHEVVLVSGPVSLDPPAGAELVPVETAVEMLAACERHWPSCEAVIGVAAVSDFRPAAVSDEKLKRSEDSTPSLALVANPDVLGTLAAGKGSRLAVGFALETASGTAEAQRKLQAKNLDWVVLNGPETQGADTASLRLLGADGTDLALGPAAKRDLAGQLVARLFG